MSRIFITIGSAHSKATNVNPVDGIWCSDCGWAGRVEEDMTDSEESEEPLFEEFSEYVPKFCPNCGVNLREPQRCPDKGTPDAIGCPYPKPKMKN